MLKIKEHARRDYPYECCGAMLGKAKEVTYILELENINSENPTRRFQIKPQDFLKVENMAREKKLDFIGIYHSHPDHPARPSQYDFENAWEGLSYLIVSVEKGNPSDVKSYLLNPELKKFEEEEILIKT